MRRSPPPPETEPRNTSSRARPRRSGPRSLGSIPGVQGKTVVITGATSGIGLETARRLAAMRARIVMVARNAARAEAAVARIGGDVHVVYGDLASQATIRDVAGRLLQEAGRIDVLISNAGVFRARRALTADGIEETLATNHLAPFLLTHLLLDRLRESRARIVVVASDAHHSAALDPDDLQFERRRYSAWRAYANSKLCNVLFASALARRLEGTGVAVNALHPGFVRTRLGSGNRIPIRPVYWLLYPWTISVERGAETSVYVASSPEVEGVSGKYFARTAETVSSRASYDEVLQERVWEESARLVGL